MSDIRTTLNACELVWRQQSIADSAISDMRSELESHLREAELAGKTSQSVVGSDINRFARSWAGVEKPRSLPSTTAHLANERASTAQGVRIRLSIALGAIALITLLGAILGPKTDSATVEPWQWGFVIATFVLLVGELLTGGFFVLPFGIGAAAASVLAFAKVEPALLGPVFLVVSILALWGLREYALTDDDTVVPVGANRYVGQHAVVTEPIAGVGTTGRVRFETENWMAITDDNERIAAETVVTVIAVRGARLVVSAV